MTSSRTTAGQRLLALALGGAIGLVRRIDPVRCSNAGGRIARLLGPRLSASRTAIGNLALAYPDMAPGERVLVMRRVWDNLGRTVAELPHLAGFERTESGPGWEVVGEQHLAALAGGQALFFSGHLGNWEMVLPIAAALGVQVSGFYRASSNAAVNAAVQGMRETALTDRVSMFPKGARGARLALAHMLGGGSLGLLVDQKMNDGIAVPFFGRDAMTAPALAQFALRCDAPVLPVHVVRLGPARFRMVCEAPIAVVCTGDRAADVLAISLLVNATLERWIRADPACWLWLHRRWPRQARPV